MECTPSRYQQCVSTWFFGGRHLPATLKRIQKGIKGTSMQTSKVFVWTKASRKAMAQGDIGEVVWLWVHKVKK